MRAAEEMAKKATAVEGFFLPAEYYEWLVRKYKDAGNAVKIFSEILMKNLP